MEEVQRSLRDLRAYLEAQFSQQAGRSRALLSRAASGEQSTDGYLHIYSVMLDMYMYVYIYIFSKQYHLLEIYPPFFKRPSEKEKTDRIRDSMKGVLSISFGRGQQRQGWIGTELFLGIFFLRVP